MILFLPVVELHTSLGVRVRLSLAEGRVLETVRLHPVELVIDIADQTGVVLTTTRLENVPNNWF